MQMLIPKKCPGAADKAKVTSASDPPPAQRKPEIDTVVRWENSFKMSALTFHLSFGSWIFFIASLCVFRSSSVDTPPVETVISSVHLHEETDVKETASDVIKEKVEESPSPAIAQPPHTSPDLSFASEVTSQNRDLQ